MGNRSPVLAFGSRPLRDFLNDRLTTAKADVERSLAEFASGHRAADHAALVAMIRPLQFADEPSHHHMKARAPGLGYCIQVSVPMRGDEGLLECYVGNAVGRVESVERRTDSVVFEATGASRAEAESRKSSVLQFLLAGAAAQRPQVVQFNSELEQVIATLARAEGFRYTPPDPPSNHAPPNRALRGGYYQYVFQNLELRLTMIEDNSDDHSVHFGNGATLNQSPVVTGELKGYAVSVAESNVSTELKEHLDALVRWAETVAPQLPPAKSRTLVQDVGTLVNEATGGAPRTPTVKVSAEGILEAAKSLGETGAVVVDLLKKLVPLLGIGWAALSLG